MALLLPLDCRWSSAPPLSSPSSSSSHPPHRPPQSLQCSRLSFFGSPHLLRSPSFSPPPPPSLPFITAIIKRRKDVSLDKVIQSQKKLKIVLRIKEILVKQPGLVMSLKHLGKYRRYIGLQGRRRCIALLRRYPAVFEVFEEGVSTLYFRFSPEAEDQFLEEQKIREELESALVTKVRKLLMMSFDRRLLLEKIGHIKRDLGLPDDFKTNFVEKYPQFFKVVETESGTALELTHWDPELAISAAEKTMAKSALEKEKAEAEDTISGRPRKFHKIDLPKGFNLKRKDKEVIRRFQDLPFFSPYADVSGLNPASLDAEKHACAVVHELLSLTLEKRTLVDHLTHFRKDYKFSQRIRSMLIRHPEMFYVSFKGDRDSVFLREAYNGSELIEKDPLVLAKEKLGQLVALGRDYRINEDEEEDDEDEEDEDGEDDWSDDDDEDIDDSETYSDDEEDNEDQNEEKRSPKRSARPAPRQLSKPRELRRPIEIVEREKALALISRKPKERW